MNEITETNAEIIEKYNSQYPVSSVELGGIGPRYEMAIQDLLWTVFSEWSGSNFADYTGETYPEEFVSFVEKKVSELEKRRKYGFSGSQVGAAKATAFQFIRYGYAHMMNKLEEDRRILITKPASSLRDDVLKDIETELTSAEAMLAIHDPARTAIHTAIMRVRSKYAIEALG